MKLLSDKNTKLLKSSKFGYISMGLSLAPFKLSGKNLCPHASPGCAAACLNTAGMGRFPTVKQGRLARAKYFNTNPAQFIEQLKAEITIARINAKKARKKLSIRLNVLSDIPWEKYGIMENFRDVQFMDYTKNPFRALQHTRGQMPANYHLTFSRSEKNDEAVQHVLNAGGNVAVVFRDELPATYLGKPVVDGDVNDLRFLDPKNCVVGLSMKGKAKLDKTGFVV